MLSDQGMIDDNDVTTWAVGFPVIGPITAIIFLVGFVVLSVYACENEADCSKRSCEHGQARLLDGECVCAEAPK